MEVLLHVPIGRADPSGSHAHHVVAAEQYPRAGNEKAQVIRRVARGMEDLQLQAADGNYLPVGQGPAFHGGPPGAPGGGISQKEIPGRMRPDGALEFGGQFGGRPGMVGMAMGQNDGPNPGTPGPDPRGPQQGQPSGPPWP